MKTTQFLSLRDVIAKTTLGKSSIYKKMAEGTFPQNYKICANKVIWKEEEIIFWMNSQQFS